MKFLFVHSNEWNIYRKELLTYNNMLNGSGFSGTETAIL